MIRTEISVFEIENLSELSCQYQLYKIIGLSPDSEEYDKNVNMLIRNLSGKTQSPCTQMRVGDELFIAQPTVYSSLPNECNLIRLRVKIEPLPELHYLDFSNLDEVTAPLAERFIQFQLHDSIMKQGDMWRPKPGAPFFSKTPDPEFSRRSDSFDLYHGFSCRVLTLPDYKLGIAIDRRTKYLSKYPLPKKISPEYFRKIKGSKAVYEYGKDWFEIKIIEKGAQNCKEHKIDNRSLYEWVESQYIKIPKSNLFNSLEKDCDSIVYLNSSEQRRAAPSGMCKLCIDTQKIGGFHRFSILSPYLKRNDIYDIARNRLSKIEFNGNPVRISQKMFCANTEQLKIPALMFGNNRTLEPSQLPSIKDLGSTKRQLLYSQEAGFHSTKTFDEQYVVIPSSIMDSFGEQFIVDLQEAVNKLYGVYSKYEPTIIPYDDSGKQSVPNLANRIFASIDNASVRTGYAVIMVPNLEYSNVRSEDELANAVMAKLRDKNIHSSIIHTTVCSESFMQTSDFEWVINPSMKGKYSGYLKNVAITKVLLLNDIKPFVLKDRLTTDIAISIDVKNNVAGFTIISDNGEHLKFKSSVSGNKELLNANQIKKYLIELISTFKQALEIEIHNILILRDGRLFQQEKIGIGNAMDILRQKNIVSSDCKVTYCSIRKTSLNPVRIFRVQYNPSIHKEMTSNPIIGTYLRNKNEAYLLSTGFPYKHDGTSLPIHITFHEGGLSFDESLQDIFSLTNLTWTKIDDCSREPLPIKFCDIQLRSIAGDFDNDEIEFHIPDEVLE